MGAAWSKSGQIEFDNDGERADGCLAYFFAGGTTTPLTVYEDADETTPHDHPLEADANGRWPLVFIPFTASYDVKVVTEGGTQLYYYREIPNANPVEASVDSVDAAELIATGDWKFRTTTGTLTGYVRANGRTIGSASSGATERANADTEDLYTLLWNGHGNTILAVATGRGASAAADFAANKAMALPDARSAGLVGADDMGNSAAGLGYGGSFTTGSAILGASIGGTNTHTLGETEIPTHTHAFSATTSSDGSHNHSITDPGHAHVSIIASGNTVTAGSGAVIGVASGNTQPEVTGISIVSGGGHTHTVSGTSGTTGGGTAHNNMPRHVIGTWYVKL